MSSKSLLAIRLDRRAVATVLFRDLQLEHAQVRHLHSQVKAANESAVAFIRWLVTCFAPDAVAVERIEAAEEYRRVALTGIVLDTVRAEALPVFDATKRDLFEAFAAPTLTSRKSLREIIESFWPALAAKDSNVLIQDAAALGLYIQAERLLTPEA